MSDFLSKITQTALWTGLNELEFAIQFISHIRITEEEQVGYPEICLL